MSYEQKRFFYGIAVVTGTFLVLSVLTSFTLNTAARNRTADAERIASESLTLAYSELRSSGDPDTRLQNAMQHGRNAESALLASLVGQDSLVRLLMRLSATLPFSANNTNPSSSLSLRVQTLNDSLNEISEALPGLRRLAGYDALSDMRSASDKNDLYVRLYMARDGLRKIIRDLASLPNSEGFQEAHLAVVFAQKAYDETETLLILLNPNTSNSNTVDISAFQAAAVTSAGHAQKASQVLLSEERLRALTETAQ